MFLDALVGRTSLDMFEEELSFSAPHVWTVVVVGAIPIASVLGISVHARESALAYLQRSVG